MGLLELLQRGQTILSAGSFPGDTPINDPQSGFIQDNSPTHTYYGDETVGQPNNGSDLIKRLVFFNASPSSSLTNSKSSALNF